MTVAASRGLGEEGIPQSARKERRLGRKGYRQQSAQLNRGVTSPKRTVPSTLARQLPNALKTRLVQVLADTLSGDEVIFEAEVGEIETRGDAGSRLRKRSSPSPTQLNE